MKITEVRTTVQDFMDGFLDGASVNGKCLVVCSPLSSYLNFTGYSNELVRGTVYDTYFIWDHYWLSIGEGEIIDPTAGQFLKSKSNDDIFIGLKPKWYTNITVLS